MQLLTNTTILFSKWFYYSFLQVGSANPAPSAATNGSAAYQQNTQTGSSNQVRVGDAFHLQQQQQQHQQPPPPRRSSSLLPTLRRRASEPLPHSHRQRYTQRPGETHTRYTFGFNQRERRSAYTFGFTQRDVEYSDDDAQNDVHGPATRYEFGFVSHSQMPGSFDRATEGNLNRESFDYGHAHGHARSRTPADMQGRTTLDNTHNDVLGDAQGNTHGCKSGHARSRMLDAIHGHVSSQSASYTENIRAMAGQMYGDPPTHSRIPSRTAHNRNTHRSADRYLDAHSHNYAHNRALTRHHHHLRLSGGLWHRVCVVCSSLSAKSFLHLIAQNLNKLISVKPWLVPAMKRKCSSIAPNPSCVNTVRF